MAEAEKVNPRQTSSDYDAMIGFWRKIDAILAGANAMRAPAGVAGEHSVPGPATPYAHLSQLRRGVRSYNESPYLPRFPNEGVEDYERRRCLARFTNIYGDASRNLSSRPFRKPLTLADESGEDLKQLEKNIDGQGHGFHVVGQTIFKAGIDHGIHWVLVDYTNVPPGVTLAAEREMGARPYWCLIPAERMVAVYSEFVNGREIIVHARIEEPFVQRDGYGEKAGCRVREFDRLPIQELRPDGGYGKILGYAPATWKLWEQVTVYDESTKKDETTWVIIDQGDVSIQIIPLVPFVPTARDGISWRVEPPLRDLADQQITLFQQESNLDAIKEQAAFPMLAGNGVESTNAKGEEILVPVGPKAVLFAPPGGDGNHGEWAFIEPTAASLTFLETSNEKLRTEMRELAMQPMAAANLTVVTTANQSMKAHSQLEAWAILFEDAMELAWHYTCLWLGQPDVYPEIVIHKDFGIDLKPETEPTALLKAEEQGIISKRTVQDEFKRRSILSENFDPEEEEERLAEQQAGLEPEQQIDPRTGQPIPPRASPRPPAAAPKPTLQ